MCPTLVTKRQTIERFVFVHLNSWLLRLDFLLRGYIVYEWSEDGIIHQRCVHAVLDCCAFGHLANLNNGDSALRKVTATSLSDGTSLSYPDMWSPNIEPPVDFDIAQVVANEGQTQLPTFTDDYHPHTM